MRKIDVLENQNLPGDFKVRPKTISILKIKLQDHQRLSIYLILGSLLLTTVLALPTLIPAKFNLASALAGFFDNLKIMFLQPNLGDDTFQALLKGLGQSIALAVLTTIIGAILAFGFGLMAARNLAPVWLSTIVQSVMAFIRAIPTIIWVLIYSITLGLGPNAAVLGLTFHSVAYLTKVYADSFEDIAPEVLNALRATGAGFLALVFQVLVPSSMKRLLSWTFIRFEINFADAVAVGAAAGAGGIGYQLFMASNIYFNFHEVGTLVYLVLAFALVLEFISYQMRTRLMK